jgi:hypothetical protein
MDLSSLLFASLCAVPFLCLYILSAVDNMYLSREITQLKQYLQRRNEEVEALKKRSAELEEKLQEFYG